MARRAVVRTSPDWLVSHRRWILAMVIVAAAVVRLTFFVQLNASPLIDMHRWDQSDMNYYDAWARAIAGGDWLSRTIAPPMHAWQRQVADQWLRAHPEEGASGDVQRAVWTRWMGTPRFYQDPLYMYVLASIYLVSPAAPTAIAVQLTGGVLATALIWLIALHLFDDVVALTAAILAVLCAPLVFYEGLLLRESFVSLAGLVIISGLVSVLRRPPIDNPRAAARPLLLGLACGLGWLLKSTFVVLAIAVLIGLAIVYRRQRRTAVIVTGAMAVGFFIGVLPLVARNVAVGVAPLSLAALGPFTFLESNSATANPDAGWEVDPAQLAAFLGGTDGGLPAAIRTTLEAHTPGSYASLLWRKWDRMWHWFEIPNNENFYYARRYIPVLAWMPITFLAVAPLALAGLFLGLPRIRMAWPLYLLVAFSALSIVAFVVVGRQRVPLMAALIPFAALTIVETGRALRDRRFVAAFALLVAVGAAGAWTGRPRASDQFDIRTADWLLPFSIQYQPRIDEAIARQDWEGAAAAYREYFAHDSPTAEDLAAAEDATLAPTLAKMHAIHASLLARAGEDPLTEIAEAEALLRTSGERVSRAGSQAAVAREDVEAAAAIVEDARRTFAGAMSRRGVEQAEAGRMPQAVEAFRRAAAVDTHNSHAHYNLARALAAQGNLAEALTEAQQAVTLAPDEPAPRALLAEIERALKRK